MFLAAPLERAWLRKVALGKVLLSFGDPDVAAVSVGPSSGRLVRLFRVDLFGENPAREYGGAVNRQQERFQVPEGLGAHGPREADSVEIVGGRCRLRREDVSLLELHTFFPGLAADDPSNIEDHIRRRVPTDIEPAVDELTAGDVEPGVDEVRWGIPGDEPLRPDRVTLLQGLDFGGADGLAGKQWMQELDVTQIEDVVGFELVVGVDPQIPRPQAPVLGAPEVSSDHHNIPQHERPGKSFSSIGRIQRSDRSCELQTPQYEHQAQQ